MNTNKANAQPDSPLRNLIFFLILIALAIAAIAGLRYYSESRVASIHNAMLIGFSKDINHKRLETKDTNNNRSVVSASYLVQYQYDGSAGAAYIGGRTNLNKESSANSQDIPVTVGKNNKILLQIPKPTLTGDIHTDTFSFFIYTIDPSTKAKKILSTKEWKEPMDWIRENYVDEIPDFEKQIANARKEGLSSMFERARTKMYDEKELSKARDLIDNVLKIDRDNAEAYVVLAQIALVGASRENNGHTKSAHPEAERLIDIALKKDTNSLSAHILRGYLLMGENKEQKAISEFQKFAPLGAENLWIYDYWGLALEKVESLNSAIKKYEEGIAQTPFKEKFANVNNRAAFKSIFQRLKNIYEQQGNIQAIDKLFEKRIATMYEPCERTRFAEFKLYRLGDYDSAIKHGTKAQEQSCDAGARPLLAAAYLTKWAQEANKLSIVEAGILVDRGHAYMSNTQDTIVQLAQSPHTIKVIAKLKDAGIKIDTIGNDGLTALAELASQGNLEATQILLDSGADPNALLKEEWTPLMMAVTSGQAKVVKLLLKFNADPNRKNKQGQSASSIANDIGNPEIIKLFSKKVAT